MDLIDRLSEWWAVKKTPNPPRMDLICLVSFGITSEGHLTRGLKQVLAIGQELLGENWHAKIVFGEFTENKEEGLEEALKKAIFSEAILAGQVISTVEESLKWRKCLSIKFSPKNIMVVTEEMHSRSAHRASNRVWNGIWYKRVWKWLTGKPMVKIHVVTFKTKMAIDPKSPMVWLRDQRKWVAINVIREIFLMVCPFGYTVMGKMNFHQPTDLHQDE